MTAAPVDTFYPVKARGKIREEYLNHFRYGLRSLTNPDTNAPFTDVEIALATNEKSEAYRRADALDAVLFVNQQRGLYLAQQWDPLRANTSMLKGVHGYLWDEPYLQASGGSGTITAPCNPLTTFTGSTTIGDPTAMQLVTASELRFQVLFTKQAGSAATSVQLSIVGINTGTATNLEAGTKLKWMNGPLGATGDVTVNADFTGGLAAETDYEFALRILRLMRNKQGAGNRAQVRAWAERAANNAVESAFVYPCALHAGTTIVCITQKAGSSTGPTARVASVGTLASVTAYLTPPGSPVMPVPPRVVVTTFTGTPTNMVLSLAMPVGTSAGWDDLQPWPGQLGGTGTVISAINVGGDPLAIKITCPVDLPSGVTQPQMMVWDDASSTFEELAVTSVALDSGTTYDVVLTQAPTKTLAVGDYISPYSSRAELLSTTIDAYFKSLGPGEVIDVSSSSTDSRRSRAYRFPKPNEEYPQRAGTNILTFLQDALGAGLSDSIVQANSVSTPSLPTDPVDGPNMIVAGKIGVYSL